MPREAGDRLSGVSGRSGERLELLLLLFLLLLLLLLSRPAVWGLLDSEDFGFVGGLGLSSSEDRTEGVDGAFGWEIAAREM